MRFATIDDTPPEVQRILIEGYRRMSLAQKLQRMVALTQGVQQLALARIRAAHPAASEREQQLRLASLWLPADIMRDVFDWDPAVRGY